MVSTHRWHGVHDSRQSWSFMAGAWLAVLGACAGDKAGTDEATWEGGIYHVEVELDTADPLSDLNDGVTATVGTISDLVADNLYLYAWHLKPGWHDWCSTPGGYSVVEGMKVFVGDWYVDLLLPTEDTCFAVLGTMYKSNHDLGEFEVEDGFRGIECSAGIHDPVEASNDAVILIDLKVTCDLFYEGDCDGDCG